MHLRNLLSILTTTTIISCGAFVPGGQAPLAQSLSKNLQTANLNDTRIGPDTHALRYYAKRGETDRYEAELARLRRLYPNFVAPSNVLADPADEEKPFWVLFSQGKYDDLRAAINEKKASEPGWVPSDDLERKLSLAERRNYIGKAIKRGDWNEVIKTSNENPELLISQDIELVWFIAEAFGRLGKFAKSNAAFDTAMKISTDTNTARATIHKAAILLSADDVERLYNQAITIDDKPDHVEQVSYGLVRGMLERILENGQKFPARFKPQYKRFVAHVDQTNEAIDINILAWSNYRQQNYEQAIHWFSKLDESDSDIKYVEGKVLSLKDGEHRRRALEVATRWREASDEIGRLYINLASASLLAEKPIKHSAQFLSDFVAMTKKYESGEGAEALAWYAFNVKQYKAANAWFGKAINWDENESRVYGYVLTAALAKDKTSFDIRHERYRETYPKVAALDFNIINPRRSGKAELARLRKLNGRSSLSSRIVSAYNAKKYTKCLRLSTQLIKSGRPGAEDYQMRGWCLLKLNRPTEAQEAFANAVRKGGKGRPAAAYGESLASLQIGETDRALSIANSQAMNKKNRRIVDLEILVQRARSAFSKGDYHEVIYALNQRRKRVTESRDLGLMRGWSYYHMGDLSSAKRTFASLDGHYSTRESRRALSVVQRSFQQQGGRLNDR